MAGRRKLLTPHGPEDWRVVFKNLPRNYYGLCHWQRKAIEIAKGKCDEITLRTLIHEATHVAVGEDFNEPLIERVEHNVFVTLVPWLAQRFGIDMEE